MSAVIWNLSEFCFQFIHNEETKKCNYPKRLILQQRNINVEITMFII